MKKFNLFAVVMAITLMTACSPISKLDDPIFGLGQKGWPDYVEQPLAGRVFGQNWKALTAVVKPFGSDKSQVSLEFYSEVNPKACTGSLMPSKPFASVVIPAAYTQTEYISDMEDPGTGNPLVFKMFSGEAKKLLASKTKIRVNSITATGLVVSVYAQGADADGAVSEINGSVAVTDCAKAVDFSVWEELAGWYTLQNFDGQAVQARTSILKYENNSFYNRAAQAWVKTLVFPLYASVSTNTDMTYNFGPMEGLGATTVSVSGGTKTYTYSYHGPIYANGVDVTMALDMTVMKSGSTMSVTYTLEVPSYIKKVSHTFTVTK
ncbi:MAG: hypothetical protein IPM97_01380 [Bdellovibrionaceae bacterium]|nr:hypothetical protein [Pseudobdellovibrionaceae bacterium]